MQARLENALLAFPTVPGSFKWEVGVTPLSDPRWVVFAPLLYVLSVVGAKELLGERTLRLGPLPALHNLVLALGSAAMFAGTGLEAWRAWRLAGSAEWLFCLPAGSVAVGPLFWWSYVYYLSKARAACLPASLPGTRLTLPARRPVLRAAGHLPARRQGPAADAVARVPSRHRDLHGVPGACAAAAVLAARPTHRPRAPVVGRGAVAAGDWPAH